jgi:DNA adenine methylase
MFYSPLRYPGGKNRLAKFIAKICIDNKIDGQYVEPYAGGASVALYLLFNSVVDEIIINDKDRSIYAFWHSILHNSNKLCELINKTEISIDNWKYQKEVQKNKKTVSLMALGFSTLFLNRTNISGILNGGVMGGKKQKGNYKIDCRFNKEEIIRRINYISEKKNRIRLYNKDAITLIEKLQKESLSSNSLFYFDPPYYHKGSSLYLNYYKEDDHAAVCDKIKQIKNIRWIISYDNVSEIKKLYSLFNKKEYYLAHTAHKSKLGREILFFSKDLQVPKIINPISCKMKRNYNCA